MARFLRKERPSHPSVLNALRYAVYLYELKHGPCKNCALQHDEQARAICKDLLAQLYNNPYLRIRTLQLLFNMVDDWTTKELLFAEANCYYMDLRAIRTRGEHPEADTILDSIAEELSLMNKIQEENDPNRDAEQEDPVDAGMGMLAISDIGSSSVLDTGEGGTSEEGQDEETRTQMELYIRLFAESGQRVLEKRLIKLSCCS